MSKWVVSGLLAVIVGVGLIFSVVTTRNESEVSAQQTDEGTQQQTEIQEQLSTIQDELALVRGQLSEVQDELGMVRNQLARFTRVLWPAKSDPAAYTKAFVEQAIRRYDAEGRDATIAFYNSMDSVDGAWYVFIADENDLMVAHPVQEIRGQKVQGPLGTDITGYDFGAEIVTATADGKWVDYVYLNPADKQHEIKHAWVVRHDGLLFGSGWYEPLAAKADPAAYTKAFVEFAIRRYEAMGRDDAIAFYNSMASVDGAWYVFIADENDLILAHPTVPENIGEDLQGPLGTDSNGYNFGAAIASATADGKWVDYVYLNPAHDNRQETKHTWVVRHDGLIFGSGWYEPMAAKADPAAYTKAFVNQAISRYDAEGRDDTIAFYNSMDSVDDAWYVFIADENDIILAHPTVPENIGEDLKGPLGTDSNGYNFGAAIASATAEGKWVDYIYLNPAHDNRQETKHTWVVRHDGLIFGSGWYEPMAAKADPVAYTKAFVNQAISRYDTEGRDDTIAFYNSMDSVDDAWYVFIADENDIILAHPTVPENIGEDLKGPLGTDSNGYNFGAAIASATVEGKWVDYIYLNPAHDNRQETKHTWVVRHDGLIFGSGWYEPTVTKADPAAYTKAFVNQAISRYDAEGRDDTIAFYNSMDSVDDAWYVFIADENDIILAHPTVPENIGEDLKGPLGTDSNGYNFGAAIASATAEGKWVDYVYLNPAHDNRQETKHTWVVRHDGLIFGSGWYEPTVTKADPAAYTKAFVNQAISRYDAEGRDDTIAFYNSMDSVDGAWYVFIIDENDILIAHPILPENIGQDNTEQTDSTGYNFGAEVATATAEGKWVDYIYLNPAHDNQQETKHAWVVRHDGLIFGSGWYEPTVTKADPAAYTKAFVNQAISRYDAEGRDDTIAFYNSMDSVDGAWYVFIIDANDILIAHPIRPENIGQDTVEQMDSTGYNFGAEMVTATAEGKWVDYVYLNPAHDNQQETKHAWVVRHDGLIFGSGWYEQETVLTKPSVDVVRLPRLYNKAGWYKPLATKSDPAAYTKAFVNQAIRRYDTMGRDAALEFYNSMDSVDGEWYIFIADENDITIVHPTIPEHIGDDIKIRTDSNGYNFGTDIAAASEEGQWVDYTHQNPATNQYETKHSWVIRHDGLIFGSGWYER